MPRGVYERKPKDKTTPSVPRKTRAPKPAAGRYGIYAGMLDSMRRDRDALDAAIKALEILGSSKA